MKQVLTLVLVFTSLTSLVYSQDALELYRQRRYAEAVDVTIKEITADRNNMDAYSVLGWSLNLLKRHGEAVDYGRRAWTSNRADHRIAGILAEAYYGLKQDANAIEWYERFLTMGQKLPGWDPRNLRDAYRDMGEIYLRLKEWHRADLAFTTAIGYDRGRSAFDNARAAALIARAGFAREQLGDIPRSQAAYNEALAKDANNQDAKLGLERLKTRT